MGSGASRENNDAAYMKYVQQRQCSDAPGQTMSQEEESSSAMLKGTPAPTVVTGGVVTEVYNCAQTASTVETGLRASYSAKSAQSITVNGGASQLAKNRGDRPIVPKPQNITYKITPTTDGCEIPSRSNFVPSEQTVNTQSLGGKAPEMKGVRGTPPRPRQSHPKNTLVDKKLFLAPMQKGESDQFFKRMIEKYYSIATDTTVAAPVFADSKGENTANAKGTKCASASECHWAAYKGDVKTLEHLLHELEESAVLDSSGRTPLFYAASQGHVDCCAFLLDHRHEWANIVDRKGDTSLHVAAHYRHTSVVQLLLQTAADVSIRNGKGYSPLHVTDSSDSAKMMIEYGADVMSVCKKGRTPLFCAAATNRLACTSLYCELFTEYPRMINLADHRGDTALHAASANGNLECAKLLLDAVADVAAKNVQGLTPIEVAGRNKHEQVVGLLGGKGGDGMGIYLSRGAVTAPNAKSPTAKKALEHVYQESAMQHRYGNMSDRDYSSSWGNSMVSENDGLGKGLHRQFSGSHNSTSIKMVATDRGFNYDRAGTNDDVLARLQAVVNTPGRVDNELDGIVTMRSETGEEEAISRLQTVVQTPGRDLPVSTNSSSSDLTRLQAIVNTPGRTVDPDSDSVGDSGIARLKMAIETPGRCAEVAETQWTEIIDPSSGHIYYQNSVTGESQWESPY